MRSEKTIDETTSVRLMEWEIGYGTVSRYWEPGRISRLTNQCAVGTISIRTLLHLLVAFDRL